MHHLSHHAHTYHAGSGFDFGGALMSGAVRFAEWRILGAIVRALGPWGVVVCCLILVSI
jgi:hypothetical protein